MSRPLSQKTEDEILSVLRDVTGLVEDERLTPTDAVVKTARDRRVPLTLVPLLSQAYNVGRCAYQRETGEGVLGKTAMCELADAEQALKQLAGECNETDEDEEHAETTEQKKASWPAWRALPSSLSRPALSRAAVKAAEVALPARLAPPLQSAETAKERAKRQKREEAERKRLEEEYRRGALTEAKAAFVRSLYAVSDYFRKDAYARLPFAEVRQHAAKLVGLPAATLLDHIHHINRLHEPQTLPLTKLATVASLNREPYSLLQDCCKAASQLLRAHRQYVEVTPVTTKDERRDAPQPGGSVLGPFFVKRRLPGRRC